MRRLWRWLVESRRRHEETAQALAESYEAEADLWERIARMRGDGASGQAHELAMKRRREARRRYVDMRMRRGEEWR
jgi:hypothetical protein